MCEQENTVIACGFVQAKRIVLRHDVRHLLNFKNSFAVIGEMLNPFSVVTSQTESSLLEPLNSFEPKA